MIPEPPPHLRIEMRSVDTCERVMKTSGLFPLVLICLVGKRPTSLIYPAFRAGTVTSRKKNESAQCQIGGELLFNYPSLQNSLGLAIEKKKMTKRD